MIALLNINENLSEQSISTLSFLEIVIKATSKFRTGMNTKSPFNALQAFFLAPNSGEVFYLILFCLMYQLTELIPLQKTLYKSFKLYFNENNIENTSYLLVLLRNLPRSLHTGVSLWGQK
jgi:hypothetical protein